jgi:hypothetical protein
VNNKFYEACTLPFGWNQSPYFFIRLVSLFIDWLKNPMSVAPEFPFSAELAKYNYTIIAYLDDFLIVSYDNLQATT